jgi:hypothetical protein
LGHCQPLRQVGVDLPFRASVPAVGGTTPGGQAIGDQSQLTACGGFTVIRASVKNVNLPNGTPLWGTLGGEPIGRIVHPGL